MGGVRVTKPVKASLGVLAGLLLLVAGVAVVAAFGVLYGPGWLLVVAGVVVVAVFGLVYDVDERREASP